MKRATALSIAIATSFSSSIAFANPDLNALRSEIERIRSEYESRISNLEKRLEAAEASGATTPAPATSNGNASKSGIAALNPAVGAVLVGTYRDFDREEGGSIQGFAIGEEAGRGEEGFSIGETEINLKAPIDDKFFGNLTFALADEDGELEVELEEAWLQTTALPYGLTTRFGRFFSDAGYLNQFHRHADNFVDRPLPYRAFFGNQLTDDGVRLSWIAPTDLFIEVGAEWFRGASFPAAGADKDGKGSWTTYAHVGGDLGISNSWRAGLSKVGANTKERETGEDENMDGGLTSFTGDSDLIIADLVWKWSPNGNPTDRFLKLQAEYFQRDESGEYALDLPDAASDITLPYSEKSRGWYAQAFYQFMRGWRVGLRHSELTAGDPGSGFDGSVLEREGHDPVHDSLVLEWANSEFSRLRLQFNNDRSTPETDHQLILQYTMSLGAHGAHQF